MAQPLTFAEAYKQQLKELEERPTKCEAHRTISTGEELDSVMTKIASLVEEDPNVSVRMIKSTLARIDAPIRHLVAEWRDQNELDILHNSIIYKRCDIVTFLTSNSAYFPTNHRPPTTPYAHLAAYLGHLDCLQAVIQNRPADYFKITEQSHLVKVPPDVLKKANVVDPSRCIINKKMEKLLSKIRDNVDDAEKAALSLKDDDTDMTGKIDSEIHTLDKMKTAKRRVTRALKGLQELSSWGKRGTKQERNQDKKKDSVRLDSISRSPSSSRHLFVDSSSKSNKENREGSRKAEITKEAKKVKDKVEEVENEIPVHPYLKRKLIPRSRQHLVTVNWDVLSDMPQGVVKGAGKPVNVNFLEKSHVPRPHINLDLPKDRKRSFSLDRFARPSRTSLQTVKPQRGPQPSHIIEPVGAAKVKIPQPLADASKKPVMQRFEVGVRGLKRYKDFQIQVTSRISFDGADELSKQFNKTPLCLAAERGHLTCVLFLLDNIVSKNNPTLTMKGPLTLATTAKSPEAIVLLLDKVQTNGDYNNAILLAIREMYSDCLSALLSSKAFDRKIILDDTNLYHLLYSQSLSPDCKCELMPEMTRALINAKVDVNYRRVPCTFPMYTLISCAFNSTRTRIFSYLECLKILLEAKANPHHNERAGLYPALRDNMLLSRPAYSSAINCILENAKASLRLSTNVYWSKLLMKKCLSTIATCDRTRRRILDGVLFEYIGSVCILGLDRTILQLLLRYGGNPDARSQNGTYAVNAYFDKIIPHMTRFEGCAYSVYQKEIDALMIVCRRMTNRNLKEVELIFLYKHLLNVPIQALPVCRYFGYQLNNLCRSPRSLAELVGLFIWTVLKKNEKSAKLLPVSDELIGLIIPS